MKPFNNQFATQRLRIQKNIEEGSETSSGPGSATEKSGVGEQPAPRATGKLVRKKVKNEEKDVEPKRAAGPAKIYPVKKWGWKKAPSIPNRPSKGGFEYKDLWEELNENYSRFKNETKTRSKSQQMHEAVKLAEKKIAEANRILEYTSQLRTELFEGGETKYSKHTGMVMERMVKRVAEAYKKIKALK